MTEPRKQLAAAIKQYREWARYCADLDDQLAAKERDHLRTGAAARAEAEKALETARASLPPEGRRAISEVLGTAAKGTQTIAEAQAALDALDAANDQEYRALRQAQREAETIRNRELAAAARQRSEAVGSVLVSENLVTNLLLRYNAARTELSLLYMALAKLPVGVRPGGVWQSPVSLIELQSGDPTLANQIIDLVAALEENADAPLPGAPNPPFPLAAE